MSEMPSALAPEVLYEDTSVKLTRCDQGLALWWTPIGGGAPLLVFKSWPDYEFPKIEGLLFLRQGALVLRNSLGQALMPEAQLSQDECALLAKIFSIGLPALESNSRPSEPSPDASA